MSKSIKDAIMEHYRVNVVPKNLLKELEAIMSEQVVGEDRSYGGYQSTATNIQVQSQNRLLAEQRQALRKALYGKDEK